MTGEDSWQLPASSAGAEQSGDWGRGEGVPPALPRSGRGAEASGEAATSGGGLESQGRHNTASFAAPLQSRHLIGGCLPPCTGKQLHKEANTSRVARSQTDGSNLGLFPVGSKS